MAGGKLEVQIGADITDFEKKIKEVEFDIKELSKVKLEKLKVGLDTTEINAQIKDAKQNLNTLKTTVKDTGNQIGGQFTKQVGNGGNTLMQFSRIAQDAPFGIMGIGNNITATAESFSYLKAQTGSTGGALKALASSIAGTGGILLGVSLLTTGLTLLSQSGLSVGDVIDKITGKFDNLSAEMAKASQEAAKQSGSEIANMKALVSVAQDDNKSRQERLIAVKELQKEFPAYFGNLSQEQILNGNVTGTVKELTAAIIARARATAFSNKIGELSLKREELKTNLGKEIFNIADAYNLSAEESKKFYNEVKNGADVFKLLEPFKKRVGIFDLASAIASSNAIKDIRVDLVQNQKEQDAFTNSLQNSTSEAVKLKAEIAKAPKAIKTPEEPKPKKFDFKTGLDVPKEANTFLSEIGFKYTSPLLQMDIIPDVIDENLKRSLKLVQDFSDEVSGLVSGGIVDTFNNLGNAIGTALATGGNVFEAIGQSLLQSLGNFLSDMGSLLIKYGTLAVVKGKLDLAIATGGPVSIGAGLAAIAVGVALKAVGGAISSRAQGGSRASTSSGAGANNQSFSSGGFSSASGGGTVVFEIAGQKLIGVLNNTLGANKRLGGSIGLG